MIPALNQGLFLLRRLKNQLNQDKINKVANSIWTSKLRDGSQLCAKTRLTDEQPHNSNIEKLQVTQNKMLYLPQEVFTLM